ncbi:MAG: diguanylate cyclase [Nitrospirae bacterium]|nr:diguanylate cyclase [Nitrospirota bacterium]
MITLPGYTILECIHTGRSSRVYRGYADECRVPVIIKTCVSEFPTSREISRIRWEFETARSLDIPGVVKHYELLAFQGNYAIMSEDFGGIGLDAVIAGGGIGLENWLEIFRSLAGTLGEIHRRGVIHKDIKPHNIIIRPGSNSPKITDFRLSTRLSGETQQITSPDLMEGTLAYIAPEQTGRINRSVDHRADLYSLGVTMYQALTGRLPFAVTDPMELIHCHIAVQPDDLTALAPSIPAYVSDIVTKLMLKNPERRYKSAFGLMHDLEQALEYLRSGTSEPFELGRKDIHTTFFIPGNIYGRDREVGAILSAFDRVAVGRAELLLVSGDPGVGKSSVIRELGKPVILRNGHFVSGKFDQYERDVPYSALIGAFRELVRQILSSGSEAIARRAEAIKAAVGANGRIITDVIPDVAHLTGQLAGHITGLGEPVQELPPGQAMHRFKTVFSDFVKASADRESPLVLCLDDMQWADADSLKLVCQLVSDTEISNILVVGAYRSNEVNDLHPLSIMIAEAGKAGAIVTNISIGPLSTDGLVTMLRDMLSCGQAEAYALSAVITLNTHGNPFFVKRFLKTLHAGGLLVFNAARYEWTWNNDEIAEAGITDNVVELLCEHIGKLSPGAREAITFAACAGNRFELCLLSRILDCRVSSAAADIWEAVEAGLVHPVGDAYKYAAGCDDDTGNSPVPCDAIEYVFVHDRIRQAAYSLLAVETRKRIHLSIGRIMLERTKPVSLDESLFELVSHLNAGRDLIDDPAERIVLAGLNLTACRKSKLSNAYDSALRHSIAGLELAEDNDSQYELVRNLRMACAECEFLTGNFGHAEKILSETIGMMRTPVEKASVWEMRALLYNHLERNRDSVSAGISGLRELGIRIPEKPGMPGLAFRMARAGLRLRNLSEEDILRKPEMTDKRLIAAMRLIAAIIPASYFVSQNMTGTLGMIGLSIAIDNGNSALSPYMYAGYGYALAVYLGDFRRGYEYLSLAVRLNYRYPDIAQTARLNLVYGMVYHWRKHIRGSVEVLRDAFRQSLESGDMKNAGYAGSQIALCRLSQGVNIDEIIDESRHYSDLAARSRDIFGIELHRLRHQYLLALKGQTDSAVSLDSPDYSETDSLRRFDEIKNDNLKFHYHCWKAHLLFIAGQYAEADEHALRCWRHAGAVELLSSIPDARFIGTLALAASLPDLSFAWRKRARMRIWRDQRRMKRWAAVCPDNFLHRHVLVQAELEAFDGNRVSAMAFFDEAIRLAGANGFVHHEAIANERAATFHERLGSVKISGNYFAAARHCYVRWGASAKVDELDRKHPDLHAQPSIPAGQDIGSLATMPTDSYSRTTTSSDSRKVFDLMSVVRASHELSGEVVFDRLIDKLMHIVMENAGAQRCLLLIDGMDGMFLKAECSADGSGVKMHEPPVGIDERDDMPKNVINYVNRTGRPVVLDNAAADAAFSSDPYISAGGKKSVLCIPVERRGRISCILYMENDLADGVFLRYRLEHIELLSAQIGMSMENAGLYAHLEEKVRERTLELESALKAITDVSNTDSLTGLANRRCFFEYFDSELKRVRRHGRAISLLMLDIDHFKKINDTWGHRQGDEMLRRLAQILRDNLRMVDLPGRLGGEEFGVLLPETDPVEAAIVAERFRAVVEATGFQLVDSEGTINMTVSLGVCSLQPGTFAESDDLYSAADSALYRSKADGRNRATCVEFRRAQ